MYSVVHSSIIYNIQGIEATYVSINRQMDKKVIKKYMYTPVFLPEKSHGQRSLAGYSSQGRKSQT